MKKHGFAFFLFTAAAMLAVPACCCRLRTTETAHLPEERAFTPAAQYRVLDTESGTVQTLSVRDYLIGAVGAEMPASYESEALKAQVIACHTYAESVRLQHAAHPDAALQGADLSDDSRAYQGYYPDSRLRDLYGAAYETNRAKIAEAVDAVADQLLLYDGEPIVAAFHAVSSGQTESAEYVFGKPLPYLVSVRSAADRSAPQYEETVRLPAETVCKALAAIAPELAPPKEPADYAQWFSAPECTEAGTVLSIACDGVTFTGQQLREALSLRSACLTVSYEADCFSFTTRGFGHGVGMSQYGANCMARQGKSCEEILAHYYPGTVLS